MSLARDGVITAAKTGGALCSATSDCLLPAEKAGLCWGHWKRKMRGQRVEVALRERAQSRWDSMARAAIEFADSVERPADKGKDPKRAYYMACERLRFAIFRYSSRPRSKRDRAALMSKLGP